MSELQRWQAAVELASARHEGQYRRGGLPYITHPMEVAEMLRDRGCGTDWQIAGLFHDLLEDTGATEAEIEALGGPAVLRTVKLLTKEPGYVMADYVRRIKDDSMARAVKAADRLHNLRCAAAADEAFRRKYIVESVQWYLDLSPEIPGAVRELAETLEILPEECRSFFEKEKTQQCDN